MEAMERVQSQTSHPRDGKSHSCSQPLGWDGGKRRFGSSTLAFVAIAPGMKDPKNETESISNQELF